MASREKLLDKLRNGSIDANELRTLLGMCGGILKRTKGSHEQWSVNGKPFTLATHSKDLKPYQIKGAKQLLGLIK
ncbi:MAG: hypothetical protein A4S09_11435 [Proteobacteria bacterium SG_bin7]|nr:MAG: hypothetical protein A4S09_11435 [Proteobacteria bacterium SG_bin7]